MKGVGNFFVSLSLIFLNKKLTYLLGQSCHSSLGICLAISLKLHISNLLPIILQSLGGNSLNLSLSTCPLSELNPVALHQQYFDLGAGGRLTSGSQNDLKRSKPI